MSKEIGEQVDQIARMILESTHQYSYFKAIQDLATFVRQKDWQTMTHREWAEHEARLEALAFLIFQMEPRFRELGLRFTHRVADAVALHIVRLVRGTQQGSPE